MPKRKIDWSYHRPGCETCRKTAAWLERAGIRVASQVNCRKEPLDAAAATALARGSGRVCAMKGRKIVRLDLEKDQPDDETLRGLVVGPSGNLRAPTLRVGRTLIVGFSEQLYGEELS